MTEVAQKSAGDAFAAWWKAHGEPHAKELFADSWDRAIHVLWCKSVAEEAWRAVEDK